MTLVSVIFCTFSATAAEPRARAALPTGPVDAGRVLSARDPVGCAQLGNADAALRDQLVPLTDPNLMPPWLPMRAAECLIELYPHDPVTTTLAAGWLTDPGTLGLALTVARKIDTFAAADAVKLAGSVMALPEGADKERLRARFAQSASPDVQAVVSPVAGAN